MRGSRNACVAVFVIGFVSLLGCGGGGGGSGGQAACVDPRVVRDPSSVHRLSYECAVLDDGQRSFFLAGAGGPEGFLYLSDARKDAIINKLAAEGGNAIYFQSVRSHGGDGSASENPFIDGDPSKGIDDGVLDAWEAIFQRMDDAGIALFFFLYDDGAQPFGCAAPLSDSEREYIDTIVTRFRQHPRLIWMTQEEFQNGGCADPAARQRAIASVIRANDSAHAIGVHHMNGQAMQFEGDRNIGIYGQQAGSGTWAGVAGMHDAAGTAGWGDWVYVMAEAHPWHLNLLAGGNANRAVIRQSMWATAMAGGYVMLYDAFETHDPTDEMLNDLRRLQQFMESTELDALAPADTFAAGDTQWVLADPQRHLYVLYASTGAVNLGVKNLTAGTYRLSWFDPADGTRIERSAVVDGGDASFPVPPEIGAETALYLRP